MGQYSLVDTAQRMVLHRAYPDVTSIGYQYGTVQWSGVDCRDQINLIACTLYIHVHISDQRTLGICNINARNHNSHNHFRNYFE